MEQTLSQQVAATEQGRRLLQQEDAILDVTELICEIMKDTKVSKSELAKRLGKTKGYVTQVLGGANMTVRTIADIFTALGRKVQFSQERYDGHESYSSRIAWKLSQPTLEATTAIFQDRELLACVDNCMNPLAA